MKLLTEKQKEKLVNKYNEVRNDRTKKMFIKRDPDYPLKAAIICSNLPPFMFQMAKEYLENEFGVKHKIDYTK